MTQIQQYGDLLSYSEITGSRKINSSLGTEATSQDQVRKKLSLFSYSSSVSLQEDLEYSKEREIFACYLSLKGTNQQQCLFLEMKRIFEQSDFFGQEDETQFIDLSTGKMDMEGRVLSYFVKAWLKHMGYGTEKNKKYLQGRMKLFLGHKILCNFTKMYENLNLLPMDQMKKRQFLLQVCQNGWQYFIFKLIEDKLIVQALNKPPQNGKQLSQAKILKFQAKSF